MRFIITATISFGLLCLVSISSFAQEKGVCLEGPGAQAGDDAQMSVRTTSKFWLHVCGKRENSFGKDIFTEFELVYERDGKTEKIPVQFAPDERYFGKKTALGIELYEAVLMDDEWLPLFKRVVTCKGAACKITPARCAQKKPSHAAKSAKPLIELYQKESMRRSSTGSATDRSEIDVVLAAALSGEQIAIDAFKKNPGFRLDGAGSEQRYEYGKQLLNRLKKMKCRYRL